MEYTITYTAEITEIVHGDPELELQLMAPDAPENIARTIKEDIGADDVHVSDLHVFIGGQSD